MPVTETSALDAFLRHQINVERYKNYNVQQSLRVVEELKLRLSARLVRTGKDQLSDLSKREFNQFLAQFKSDYAEIFGRYEAAQLAEFKKFFKANFAETKYLFKQVGGSTYNGATVDSLWAKMLKQPASGVGVEPNKLFKIFSASIQSKMNAALKVGYTDNLSMADVIKSLTGTKAAKFRDGLISKFENQLATTVQTFIQQMTNFLAGSIGGALHDTYQWCSILDGSTTQICRERDGNVYRYGNGPLPPAHYNCRSFSIPIVVSAIADMPTFYAWLGAQPPIIQDEVLGPRQGAALRAGKVKADEIPPFSQMSPLTLDQFKAKRKQLLTPLKEAA